MAKRSGQKLRLLYLYRIMSEQTDSAHGLTLARIGQELAKYGIYAERKKLYDDIEALRLYGLEIEARRGKDVRYFVCKRTLNAAQVKILGDAVNSSRILSRFERESLMRKIIELGGKSTAALFISDSETDGGANYYANNNVDILCRAIAENKRISCRCFRWNSRKQRIMQFGGGRLVLSPWYLELGDSPRIIAYEHHKKKLLELRSDRLIELEILEIDRGGGEEYSALRGNDGASGIFGDPIPTVIRFRCSDSVADDVISHFGVEITISNNSEGCFEFSVKAPPDEKLFMWVFTHAADVTILSPESVAKEYEHMVRRAAEKI